MKASDLKEPTDTKNPVVPRGWIKVTLENGNPWFLNATHIVDIGVHVTSPDIALITTRMEREVIIRESLATVLAAIDAAQTCPL